MPDPHAPSPDHSADHSADHARDEAGEQPSHEAKPSHEAQLTQWMQRVQSARSAQPAQPLDALQAATLEAHESWAKILAYEADEADEAEHEAQNGAENGTVTAPDGETGSARDTTDTGEAPGGRHAGDGSALPALSALEPVGRYRLPWRPFFRIPIAVEGRGGDLFEMTLTRHEAEVLYRHWCTMRREVDECRRMNSVGNFTLQMGPCSLERMGHLERVLDRETAQKITDEVYAGFDWERYRNWGGSAADAADDAAAAPDEADEDSGHEAEYEVEYEAEDHA